MSTDDRSLSFPKLGESNYEQWRGDMQALLMQKGVWGIINQTSKWPADGVDAQERWDIHHDSAAGLIYNCLERSQQTLVKAFLSEPVKMWEELKKIHQQQNAATRYNALVQFFQIKKGNDESFTSLITCVEDALQKVQATCPADLKLDQFEQELSAMVLLQSLPDDYRQLWSTLLHTKSVKFSEIKSALIQEQQVNDQPHGSELAMKASSSQKGRRNKTKQPGSNENCSHCGKAGHTRDWCFKLRDEIFKDHVAKEKSAGQPAFSGEKGAVAATTGTF